MWATGRHAIFIRFRQVRRMYAGAVQAQLGSRSLVCAFVVNLETRARGFGFRVPVLPNENHFGYANTKDTVFVSASLQH